MLRTGAGAGKHLVELGPHGLPRSLLAGFAAKFAKPNSSQRGLVVQIGLFSNSEALLEELQSFPAMTFPHCQFAGFSKSVRTFDRGEKSVPDHSSLTKIRDRFPRELTR